MTAVASLPAGRLRSALAAVRDLLLPRVCAACGRLSDSGDDGVVCARCWARVTMLPHPICERCGHPIRRGPCAWCPNLAPFVRAARSVCWVPGGAGADVVHALKYEGWTGVADGMAERMRRLPWPADVVAERTALVPVPLSTLRARERGYNQSALIARALGRRLSLPVWDDVVHRGRHTETQTRLTPEERLRNVAGAFRAADAARSRLGGAHVVLVDDVVTTAATLNACAAALFRGGARIISCVTFGRARATADRALADDTTAKRH